MPKSVSISFEFVVPAEEVLATARKMASSSNRDEQVVGKSVLDLTEVTNRSKAAVEDVTNPADYDMAVYFDYKFGDSLEAAKRLESATDKEVGYVADTLISQSEAITKSKAAFQAAAKQ
ncbi:MAG: hypothetical protein C0467_22690 [Planctomycetaceae bacterium]|nr:hypothetical protein [Planctomycetaceae bacterium]